MFKDTYVFSQILSHMPMHKFRRCVNRYAGNRKVQSFTCLDQFICMAFAQITQRESLRDIETCLRAHGSKLYHLGLRGGVSRNTLANANKVRNYCIYGDFALDLIAEARTLYADDDFGVELEGTAYAFDSSTVDLCLTMFTWADFRRTKAGVKIHTLLDLRGNIPTFIEVSAASLHDVNMLDRLRPEPGAFYVMDRAYLDFSRLHSLSLSSAFFVIRAKSNLKFRRTASRAAWTPQGLMMSMDQTGLNKKRRSDSMEILSSAEAKQPRIVEGNTAEVQVMRNFADSQLVIKAEIGYCSVSLTTLQGAFFVNHEQSR